MNIYINRFVFNTVAFSIIFAALTVQFSHAAPTAADIAFAQAKVKKMLNNIDSFWLERLVDKTNGGYHLNHNQAGVDQGPAPKGIVSQARCLWYFSHILNNELGDQRHLEAANHGFDFIMAHMFDNENGGFYEQIGADGKTVTVDRKHLYGQAFMLYGLSEYVKATKNPAAARLAQNLFQTLEEKAHDDEYGGYQESFTREWSLLDDDSQALMSVAPGVKLMNTHLHIMEALTNYCTAFDDAQARNRLIELISIQSNTVVRKTLGACTDKYHRNWLPIDEAQYNVVSYGHDIENIWLLIDANRAAELPNGPYLDLYKTLFDYSLEYGYDDENGGFYDYGSFNETASSKRKVWWVQAEGVVSALEMYAMTGDEMYWSIFTQMMDWLEAHQVDWENGDWFSNIDENGAASGAKANLWKSPYHNGRAMVRCLKTLESPIKK
ncbi:MAG: AGE family epimerase/isomerase [Candidatus Hinthialibacter antarcticus]|nr:AGE family epimerase/isomerase [Candidatus Hinthialibacter antarcticus]